MWMTLMDYDPSEREAGRLSRHCPLTAMPARLPLACVKNQAMFIASPLRMIKIEAFLYNDKIRAS